MEEFFIQKRCLNQPRKARRPLTQLMCGLTLIALGICATWIVDKPGASLAAAAAGPERHEREVSSRARFVEPASLMAGNQTLTIERDDRKLSAGSLYPASYLEKVELQRVGGRVELRELPRFSTEHEGKVVGITERNEFVLYTVNPKLQKYAQEIVKKADAPHVAIVAMNPKTGQILALAEKSNKIKNLSLHAGFPAASLFKIITTAAALEAEAIKPYSVIKFRGGNYVLNKWNYAPDSRKDKRSMTVYEALGKSCNAVFGRIALNHLSPRLLREYVEHFGFNSSIEFEHDLPASTAVIPEDDFGLSRTAAGFGDVYISPIHAAALMSGISNTGLLPRPRIINEIVNSNGDVLFQAQPEALQRIVAEETADTLLKMMQSTTTIGTSRNEFFLKKKPLLPVAVAGKTGTLSGTNPKGVNHWFVGAAPVNDPSIAVSVIVVNPGYTKTKASRLGRQIIEEFLSPR